MSLKIVALIANSLQTIKTSLTGLRFRKKCPENQELEFPLKEVPTYESGMHSPMVGDRHNLDDFDFDNYEEKTQEVIDVRNDVKNNKYPKWFMDKYFPKEWGDDSDIGFEVLKYAGLSKLNPKGLANVVHMDKPDDLFEQAIVPYMRANGIKSKDDRHKSHVDFYGNVLGDNENLWDKLRTAIRKGFQAKYFFGVARPEEYISAKSGFDMKGLITFYPEGCPPHPSYPAGHSCASGATGKFVIDNFKLTHKQKQEIRSACYLWGQFRTFAGVHYADDNIAGLKIGGLLG